MDPRKEIDSAPKLRIRSTEHTGPYRALWEWILAASEDEEELSWGEDGIHHEEGSSEEG